MMLKFVKSISLFFAVILAVCIFGVWIDSLEQEDIQTEPIETLAEDSTTEPFEESSQVYSGADSTSVISAGSGNYRLQLIRDSLYVWDIGNHVLYLQTEVDTSGLDGESVRQMEEGMFLQSETEIYDFLESITS